MNGLGCLPQLLKMFSYIFVGGLVLFNLFGIIAPFWKLIAENQLNRVPKWMSEIPMWAKVRISLISLSFWSMSSFSAVITNNLQSSGTLPLVNKFINSTSFASAVNELSKYSKYPSLYKLCPVK